MLKAKLIENPRYYKLVRYQLVFMVMIIVPSIVANFFDPFEPWYFILILLIAIVLPIIAYFLAIRPLNRSLSKKTLEIDEEKIRIRDTKGLEISEWNAAESDAIITSKEYFLPNDENTSWLQKIRQTPHHNFIELKNGNQKTRLEFHLDSYYMSIQIKKMVDNWAARGLPDKRI